MYEYTGHGNFKSYLNKFNLVPSSSCNCTIGGEKNVEHLTSAEVLGSTKKRVADKGCREGVGAKRTAIASVSKHTASCIYSVSDANYYDEFKDRIRCNVVALVHSDQAKTCDEEPDTGRCRGYFPSYYYDQESGSCKEFIYGGCEGNGNRYATEEECLSNCEDS
ncbi:kunitz-type serine protease inhibitor A [Trichonephila clavipes]|nr:kunitz-type serine protease inhibitor A [Trichonephila clavipes]